MAKVEIDEGSGFCFGVVTAINKAEEELSKSGTLYCLGDIVHNSREVERLKAMGLITINHGEFNRLHNAKVLLRAHGEPPETYITARRNNIEIIDATCPVVLRLQKKIKQEYIQEDNEDKQIVIYGKNGHAEVLGLVGQTTGKAIVIEKLEEAKSLDFSKSIRLYSQTTKSLDEFQKIVEYIKEHIRCHFRILRHHMPASSQPHSQHPEIRSFARFGILRQRQEKFQWKNPVQRMQEGKSQLAPYRQCGRDRQPVTHWHRVHWYLWSHFHSQMADGRNIQGNKITNLKSFCYLCEQIF